MEWPSKESGFSAHDLELFEYEERPATVITIRLDDLAELQDAFLEDELTTAEDWETWLQRAESDITDDDATTLNLIIFRRTSKTVLDCPSEIQQLPVSESTFQNVTKTFRVHRTLGRMINRRDSEFLHLLEVDENVEPQRLIYNFRTSAIVPGDIAVSVTHDPCRRSTTAILFGLGETQERLLLYRVKESLEDFCHPLALVGAVCELERDRWIKNEVRPIESTYMEKNDQLSMASSDNLASAPEGETMEDALGLRFKSTILLTSLTAARRQLSRIGDYLQEMRKDARTASFLRGCDDYHDKETKASDGGVDLSKQQAHTAARLQHRLNQISDEFDMKIDSCKASMEDMMATTQVVMSRIARHDTLTNTAISVATRRDNSQMMSIAFVTMVFLPLTSIATIFSMNVFNWDAKDGENLINVHFWLYLAVAGASTVLTVGLWMIYSGVTKGLFCIRKRRKDEEMGS
ncbi:hypothetical protein CGCTS75_v003415 [Colletotrichum tropicale]|nr:hypothetical protein CGCTS75_v003415 [Colletotrichum tropicale]